jgi:RNA polymerase sigma-70 factor, ECF subfamily
MTGAGAAVAAIPSLNGAGLRIAPSGRRKLYYPTTTRHLDRFAFNDEYLQRLREGDPDVERHFVAYFGQLIAIKSRAIRSREVAQDIQQETFRRVWEIVRRPDGIEHAERLGAYVNSVCNNVTKELLRQDSRHTAVDVEEIEQADSSEGADEALVTEELKQLVAKLLAELPPVDARILRMHFFDEIDKDEICIRMNVDRDYLRVLMYRARTKFRIAMQKGKFRLAGGWDPAPPQSSLPADMR